MPCDYTKLGIWKMLSRFMIGILLHSLQTYTCSCLFAWSETTHPSFLPPYPRPQFAHYFSDKIYPSCFLLKFVIYQSQYN
jgi:hypothetical protein